MTRQNFVLGIALWHTSKVEPIVDVLEPEYGEVIQAALMDEDETNE